MLTIVDQHTREAMATEVRGSFHSSNVIEVPNRLARSHRKPSVIQVDNGPKFISRNLDVRAYRENVILDFSGKNKEFVPYKLQKLLGIHRLGQESRPTTHLSIRSTHDFSRRVCVRKSLIARRRGKHYGKLKERLYISDLRSTLIGGRPRRSVH